MNTGAPRVSKRLAKLYAEAGKDNSVVFKALDDDAHCKREMQAFDAWYKKQRAQGTVLKRIFKTEAEEEANEDAVWWGWASGRALLRAKGEK